MPASGHLACRVHSLSALRHFSVQWHKRQKICGDISKEGCLEDISKAWLDSSKYKLVAAGDEEMREWK